MEIQSRNQCPHVLLVALMFCAVSAATTVVTGIDCVARDTHQAPFYRVTHGHGDERDVAGRIFQWNCDGQGCWDTDDVKSHHWLACGFSYQTVTEMDLMLDASLIAEAEMNEKKNVELVDLTNVGNACSEENPCGMCQGDCDKDEDCEGDLVCSFRSSSDVTIPGCAAGGPDDIATHDYCYQPKEYLPVTVIPLPEGDEFITDDLSAIREVCESHGWNLISLQDTDHLLFLKNELHRQLGNDYFHALNKGVALGYGYYSDHTFYDLNDPSRELTNIFHEAELRGILTKNQASAGSGGQTAWVGYGWGSDTEIHDWDANHGQGHSAVFCEHSAIGAGIWHTAKVDRKTIDEDCPNKKCANVDSLAACKRLCEQDDECKVINFKKYENYRCCIRKKSCDYSTATFSDKWDIFERDNIMPRVVVDVITRAWEEDNEEFESHSCGDENPGYERIAHWDATGAMSVDTTGLGGHHFLVLCARYSDWQTARADAFVSEIFVDEKKQEQNAIWIGSTSVKGKGDQNEQPFSYKLREHIGSTMHFHIIKQSASNVNLSGMSQGQGPKIHYVPGVPVGGWVILYSGNGAGDSHSFTSILTSTDETSSHEERMEAFSSSSSWESGASVDFEAESKVGITQGFSISAHWSASEETSEEISKSVANTLTSSLENGQEVSCTFTAPDIGGALYNTWVWKTARRTYSGHITELQTCHTHVKVGPCRDQPPNCVPGYCKDQDCQDCLDESAKISTEFTLRDECKDEDQLNCHASNFDSTRWACCTEENPCGMDEGDCDTDKDCKGDLVCVQDAGAGYGVSQYVDVCMTSRLHNGRRRRLLENGDEPFMKLNNFDEEMEAEKKE